MQLAFQTTSADTELLNNSHISLYRSSGIIMEQCQGQEINEQNTNILKISFGREGNNADYS